MDELEHLISRLPRPAPSSALDARIAQVFASQRASPRQTVSPLKRTVACTACALAVGFLLGRSLPAAPPPGADRAIAESSGTRVETAPQPIAALPPVRVKLQAEGPLEQFVLLRSPPEGLFGRQPLETNSHSLITD